ncbi:MAG: asparagine synthase (glutamine-hydrolyzing) [Candidatus Kapabacteria bacterium]|nr:asparagine synthase (glutamine-hydrolyzing) [Candidatus Kapabacteria bacterium]MDW8226022.1 asparagine synthase (glutamine-hydrolyzing) [Bacteroidota bacterium]
MCGIVGIANGGSREVLERMLQRLSHRGPDDWGIEWFPEYRSGLAHRRLAILDLTAAGHQPMPNGRGTRWITYNGEIYNFWELRAELERRGYRFRSRTDTEVILAAYDEWGADCVRRFNGMFAFGIYDTETRELFLARDHLGIKPLYYVQVGSMFAFASEAKALCVLPGVACEPDRDALVSTLILMWVPEPKTGFVGIYKLPAGSYAFFRDGRLKITQYWDVPVPTPEGQLHYRHESEYVEHLRHLLERAVARQMLADVPVGAFLSGGVDSSLVVALMRRAVPDAELATYTIAFTAEDHRIEAQPDDPAYARLVAQRLCTRHREIRIRPAINALLPKVLWHLDDPVADGAAINTYLIAHHARANGTTVLLNGMGGDEVFAGYRKQLATLLLTYYHRLPHWFRKGFVEPVLRSLPSSWVRSRIRPLRWFARLLFPMQLRPLEAFIYGFAYCPPEQLRRLWLQPLPTYSELYPIRRYQETAEQVRGASPVAQMAYLDTKLFLTGLNLLYSDKASMAVAVETRPPLLDVEVVEFAFRLPDRYRIHGFQQKYLLKRAAEAYVPRQVLYRPKAPFMTPLISWMAGALGERLRWWYTSQPGPYREYLNAAEILRLLEEHRRGIANHAHLLWGCLVLAEWLALWNTPALHDGVEVAEEALRVEIL